jgi:hypothetical protein
MAAFKWPFCEKRPLFLGFARGFGFDRLPKLVPPRLSIEFSDSFLEVLDALLMASSRVFAVLKNLVNRI